MGTVYHIRNQDDKSDTYKEKNHKVNIPNRQLNDYNQHCQSDYKVHTAFWVHC